MAWGTPCLPCPDMGGAEFQTLCPHGAGMTYSGDGEYYSIVLIRLSFNFTIISNNMTNFITYSFFLGLYFKSLRSYRGNLGEC